MTPLHRLLLPLFLMFIANTPAKAVEWMSGKELIGHCKEFAEHPTSLDGVSCSSFVQGFLGGAEATDAVVVKKLHSRKDEFSSLEKRIFDTRIRQWQQTYGPTAYADYCLPRAETNTAVVRSVIRYIAAHPESEKYTAPELVYKSLLESYPCR
ncbi:MAG: hypothetical protein CMF31_03755 [Kordiimonas sp.]|nr:hypothetical protein [Kordiimonas sp.]|tara:strand:- start:3052 stop:3510 length:459 start_codon:yes stop_codon:yes gene_type:complete